MEKNKNFIQNSERASEHLLTFIARKNESVDRNKVKEAILFSIEAHSDQFRKSGMPYAEHPIEVAKLLAEYNADTSTIIAGLLHDVIEDTDHTFNDIQGRFGYEIAFMVDAVTKISNLQEKSKIARKAQTYRKLLLSMAKDPRVMFIKFADRLHNMRTLNYVPAEKKKVIARETLDVYAPLAHRFGLHKIKSELEDLSFKHLHPEQYRDLLEQVYSDRESREQYINTFITKLKEQLSKEHFDCRIIGRPKNLYSVYKKMIDRQISLENIFDIFAIRIIIDDPIHCYTVLGHVHRLWRPIQSRFKDYIAIPKSNMYQSLHTTVIGPEDKMIEIQIRTPRMEDIAERGFAAHWSYKEGSEKATGFAWLDQMVHRQEEISDSKEFLEFFRFDLKPKELVVFTPEGDSISLPSGSTVLDFAYAVHTKVGHQCIGGRIDGQFVNLDHILTYGSTVQVLRSEHQEPNLEWLNIVKTHKAKTFIRKHIRSNEATQFINLGKAILGREFKHFKIKDEEAPELEFLNQEMGFKYKNWNLFYEDLGKAKISLETIGSALSVYSKRTEEDQEEIPLIAQNPEQFAINKLSNMLIHFSTCCHPVHGDEIIGYLDEKRGLIVHQKECTVLDELPDQKSFIPVAWDKKNESFYDARLEIQGIDRHQLLDDITKVFSKYHSVNIERASIITNGKMVRNRFKLNVSDKQQLQMVIEDLTALKGIEKVVRN